MTAIIAITLLMNEIFMKALQGADLADPDFSSEDEALVPDDFAKASGLRRVFS